MMTATTMVPCKLFLIDKMGHGGKAETKVQKELFYIG